MEITTDSLFLDNGGFLSAETEGKGNAGKIKVHAADFISLNNSSLINSSVSSRTEGRGGEIDINTSILTIENGSKVSVGSDGIGDAGNISLQTGNLQLNNGFITAQTASTKSGDITLNVSEKLVLGNSSQITTTPRFIVVE